LVEHGKLVVFLALGSSESVLFWGIGNISPVPKDDDFMAKVNKNIQQKELSIEQLNAIELLITGSPDADVAQAVGVSRQTVWDWRNHDDEFAAQLERKRKALWASHEDNLRSLISKAIDILRQGMASDDERIKQAAAVHVLRCVGIYGNSIEPVGDDTAQAVANRRAFNFSLF
jgi:predicted DNA-binding protein (UPF0251 family)